MHLENGADHDFVSDPLYDRRKLRALTLIDAYTRECLAIWVDQGIRGDAVVEVLGSVSAQPKLIATSAVNPDSYSANPPLSPRAISRYSDRKREIGAGISRFDFRPPLLARRLKTGSPGRENSASRLRIHDHRWRGAFP